MKMRSTARILYAICVVMMATVVTSCGGAKGTVKTKRDKDDLRSSYPDYQTGKSSRQGTVDYTEVGNLRQQVIDNALTYLGIQYRFGGTTVSGMDCSGLIYTAHREAGINVPRTSSSMYGDARKVDEDEAVPGDLLFFGTAKSSRRVNHVGLITEVTDDEIFFIHSTTSAGVIVSSLNEEYWRNAFVKAGKIR